MPTFTLCEMLKSLPLESRHPILVAKQDPGSRCFQSADCFWVLPVAKMLWDEVVKKTLIHGHLGVTWLIFLVFRHFMSRSITFCCSKNVWRCGIDYRHLHVAIRWHDLEMNNLHFWHQFQPEKIGGPWPVGWLWNAVLQWSWKLWKCPSWILKYVPNVNYIRCLPLAARQASVASVNGWQKIFMLHWTSLNFIWWFLGRTSCWRFLNIAELQLEWEKSSINDYKWVIFHGYVS